MGKPRCGSVNSCRVYFSCVAFLLAAAFSAASAADTIGLDPTFGTNGYTRLLVPGGEDRAQSILQSSDGKVLVMGQAQGANGNTVYVARFLASGQPDTAFGTQGVVRLLPPGYASNDPLAFAIDGDTIYVAGSLYDSYGNSIVTYRLTSTGALDPAWCGTGYCVLHNRSMQTGTAVAAVLNHQFLLAGEYANQDWGGAAIRFNAVGTLDLAYGVSGIGQTSGLEFASGASISQSGRVAFLGKASANLMPACAVLESTGIPDAGFSGGAPLQIPESIASALTFDGESVVAAGITSPSVSVARILPDGTFDSGFGNSGFTTLSSDTLVTDLSNVLVDGSHQVYVVAQFNYTSGNVAHVDAHGNVVPAPGGVAFVPLGNLYGIEAAAIGGSQFLIGGAIDSTSHAAIQRTSLGGVVDSSFGSGLAAVNAGQSLLNTWYAVPASNDRVLLVGQAGGSYFAARLTSAGVLDSSYGNGGLSALPLCGGALPQLSASQTQIAADQDSLIVATDCAVPNRYGEIRRFDSTGLPDASYGVAGVTMTTWSSNNDGWRAVAAMGDHSMVTVIERVADSDGTVSLVVAHQTAAGDNDTSFGVSGAAQIPLTFDGSPSPISVIESGTNIVVAGSFAFRPSQSPFFVYRLLANGSPDTTFGSNGLVTGPQTTSFGNIGASLVGTSLYLGTSEPDSGTTFRRITDVGSIDTTYGTAGVWVTLQFAGQVAFSDATGTLVAGYSSQQQLQIFSGTPAGLSDSNFNGGSVTWIDPFLYVDSPPIAIWRNELGVIVVGRGYLTRLRQAQVPAAPSAPVLLPASDSGASASDGITNVSTPQFTGTCLDGATVILAVNTISTYPVLCVGNKYQFTLPQQYGQVTVAATQIQFGVSSPSSATTSILIDAAAPIVQIVQTPPNGQSGKDATFNFGSSDLYDLPVLYTCSLDGASYTACSPPLTLHGLSMGSHVFAIEATDTAGNTSLPAVFAWTVGTANTLVLTPFSTQILDGAQLPLTATVLGNAPTGNVAFYVDGTLIPTCTAVPITFTASQYQAACTTQLYGSLAHSLTAIYAGDGQNPGAVGIVTVTSFQSACAGYIDLDNYSTFCSAATWAQSTGVTLGCTANAYCPNNATTRLQMAAFMERMGTAYSTVPDYVDIDLPTFSLDDNVVLCDAPARQLQPKLQYADVTAVVTATSSTAVDFGVQVMFNYNGNGWTAAGDATRTSVAAGKAVSTNTISQVNSFFGTFPMQFGVALVRDGLAGTGQLSSVHCRLRVDYYQSEQ